MASPRVLDGLLVALARRARRWADRVLAERGDAPASPAPADDDEVCPDDGPPAHWLKMVRARAPHLLPAEYRSRQAARPRAEDDAENEIAMPDVDIAELDGGDADGDREPAPLPADADHDELHPAATAASSPLAQAPASTLSLPRTVPWETTRATEPARPRDAERPAALTGRRDTTRPAELTGPRDLTRPAELVARAVARSAATRAEGEPLALSRPPASSLLESVQPATPRTGGRAPGATGPAKAPATRGHDPGALRGDEAHVESRREVPPIAGDAAAAVKSWLREAPPSLASAHPQSGGPPAPRGASPVRTVWQREALRRGEPDAAVDLPPAPRPRAEQAPPFASAPLVSPGPQPTGRRSEIVPPDTAPFGRSTPTALVPGVRRAIAARDPIAPLARPSPALWPQLPDDEGVHQPSATDDLPWPVLPQDDLAPADEPRHSDERGRLDLLRLEQQGTRWSERRF